MLRRKPLSQVCEITNESFSITPEQREAYEYFDLPLPTISPAERLRHQLAFMSDNQFYWRRCARTERRILSAYPPSCPFPIVDSSYWESQEWNPFAYGRAYDFKQLFVDQLLTLWHEVPRPATLTLETDDSSAVHTVIGIRNSSMVCNSAYCERCMYSSQLYRCNDCIDCHALSNCEWCYECIHLLDCTRVYWSTASRDCSDSYFLANCSDCAHCLFCANLQGASYHIFNKRVDKKTYERSLADWEFVSHEKVLLAKRTFHSFLQEYSVPHCLSDDPFTTSGNYLHGCSRSSNSFECSTCDNCIDCNFLFDSGNCLDGCGIGVATEHCAQFVGVGSTAQRVVNSISCWNNVENLEYCANCENSRNLFACVGLRNAEYCILNKQYSRDEYERTRLSIVSLLKERDIWGRFLPAQFTAFEYNHSLAHVLMPLAKVPAQLLGFRWDTSDPLVRPSQLKARMGSEYHLNQMPQNLQTLSNQTAAREVFLCELTGRPYTVSSQERDVYKDFQVAPPQRCPEQRFVDRMNGMAPRVLEERDGMQTSFPADWFRPVLPFPEWKKTIERRRG